MKHKLKSIVKYLSLIVAGSIALMTTSASAKVKIVERTKYYTVSGKTGTQLFKDIVRKGPKTTRDGHAIATTQSKFKLANLKFGIKGKRCVVENVDVHVSLVYTFPRWNGSHRSSKKFAKNWEKFMVLVKKHEATHGRISREFARKMHGKLKKMSGRVSKGCSDFGNFSKRSMRLAQKAFMNRHRNFDRREGRTNSRIRRLQKALLVSQ